MTTQSRRNKPKTLVDLQSDDCRWPLGDPRERDFHFCGAVQLPGYPYCERHCRIAFGPAKLRIQPPLIVPSRSARAA
jgi:GcrA cell cycle regulator